jgi:hypothetical protein
VQAFDLASIKLVDAWAIRQLFVCLRSDQPLHPAAKLFLDHLNK